MSIKHKTVCIFLITIKKEHKQVKNNKTNTPIKMFVVNDMHILLKRLMIGVMDGQAYRDLESSCLDLVGKASVC